MKKFITMLIAAVAVFATSLSLSSCGDDNDDNTIIDLTTTDTYTISFAATQGTLDATSYALLQAGLDKLKKTETCSKAVAVVAFEEACNAASSSIQKTIDSQVEDGISGVSVSAYLKNSKGETVDQKTWSASK